MAVRASAKRVAVKVHRPSWLGGFCSWGVATCSPRAPLHAMEIDAIMATFVPLVATPELDHLG